MVRKIFCHSKSHTLPAVTYLESALQNIARQQDIVQNRLATGLKVSSAIDNPSSYYTASSLSNRAADLTALLDAMSQGIQTIKSASEAIDAGIKFLEQAKAVASQALETAVPAKEWFEEQVGENGAVVETAQELLDAVNTGKETIVVYGKIELENQNIELQDGQKLVNFDSDTGKFSALDFTADKDMNAIDMGNRSLVSDISISYHNLQSAPTNNFAAVSVRDAKTATVKNTDVTFISDKQQANIAQAAILSSSQGTINIEGNTNIHVEGIQIFGIYGISSANTFINGTVNIRASGSTAVGIYTNFNSTTEIRGQINIWTQGNNSCGIINAGSGHGNTTHILSDAEIYIYNQDLFILNPSSTTALPNKLLIDQNARIILSNGEKEAAFQTRKPYENKDGASLTIESMQNDAEHFKIIDNKRKNSYSTDLPKAFFDTYCSALSQYDSLLKDASYKGINLLDGQKLKINFNEDRSAQIDVMGVKADSDSLGLKTKEWNSQEDIEKSISELENAITSLRSFASAFGNAITSLRSFASAFGNYYSIVTTRQDFTENLINVLEEGADKLTLADMNEESANMLALQTSQQLAINSLSLASQAAQSVLKLF